MASSNSSRQDRAGRRRIDLGLTAAVCAVVVAGMLGMSFAAVPLYRLFCQVTGYGGTTQKAAEAPAAAIDRVMTVQFDANIGNGLGWSFRPKQREVKVKVGEAVEVSYLAENRGSRTSTGSAVFNVAPVAAGAYFNKIACFCFTQQTLEPGEKIEMPVVFFVDPAIADNSELDALDTITLSYTFYPAREPDAAPKPVAAVRSPQAASPN